MFLPTQVTLNGNVGQNPEKIETQTGTPMVTFTVACSLGQDEAPLWMDVTCFGPTALGVLDEVTKGNGVIVTGRLQMDYWEKDGQKRSKIKCIADEVGVKCFGGLGGE